MLIDFLMRVGLSDKEAKVYLALLEVGTNAVSVVAKKSGLTRTTVYSVLESLIKKKFVTCYEKNKLKYYSAEDPSHIEYLLEKKAKEVREQKEAFEEVLPELARYSGRFKDLPKVRYFEGIDGIIEIYEDTLKTGCDKLAYSSIPEVKRKDLSDYISRYLKRRTELGIHVRAIFPDTEKGREFKAKDKSLLRESRLVDPKLYPFRSEINIYGNKMAIMSLQADFLHGVIIESEAVVETERSVFELAWLGAERGAEL